MRGIGHTQTVVVSGTVAKRLTRRGRQCHNDYNECVSMRMEAGSHETEARETYMGC